MLEILQFVVHYSLHLLAPCLIVWIFFRQKWKVAGVLMAVVMFVDLDHLLANPIFDPNRCGIGVHPFHSYYAIGLYWVLLWIPNIYTRILAIGLLLHILIDIQDCLWIKVL
jgi:hypothetical protein